jgi:hypothetical protein
MISVVAILSSAHTELAWLQTAASQRRFGCEPAAVSIKSTLCSDSSVIAYGGRDLVGLLVVDRVSFGRISIELILIPLELEVVYEAVVVNVEAKRSIVRWSQVGGQTKLS